MPGEGRDGFTCFRDYRAEFNESRAYLAIRERYAGRDGSNSRSPGRRVEQTAQLIIPRIASCVGG